MSQSIWIYPPKELLTWLPKHSPCERPITDKLCSYIPFTAEQRHLVKQKVLLIKTHYQEESNNRTSIESCISKILSQPPEKTQLKSHFSLQWKEALSDRQANLHVPLILVITVEKKEHLFPKTNLTDHLNSH